ncbi:hypothetical protein S40288_09920 [Stachybotrys chartarum IBT 40288]|nr:hypothetical protein S40288_09920 [Stachybotrys chartarum IBT 40288]
MGNHTIEAPAEDCNMPCRGDPSQICGGSRRLSLYVARELLSLEPCGHNPPNDTTTTTSIMVPPSTSTIYTSSLATSTSPISVSISSSSALVLSSTTTSTRESITTPSTTTKSTSVTTTTSSLCTATTTPPSECEYKVGKWCAPHIPDFDHEDGCLDAWKTCAKLVTSCWKYAGFPASIECLTFSKWCGGIKQYCYSDCRGRTCSKKQCFDRNKPQNPSPPKPPITSTYPCQTTTTVQTTIRSTATSVVPEPTNICKQPTSRIYNYGPGNPVGGIELPLVTCNDLQKDFWNRPFKLYTEPDTRHCKSYSRRYCPDACKDACKEQYDECKETYVESCKPEWSSWLNLNNQGGRESPITAYQRCTSQYHDCLYENKHVDPGDRCRNWGTGLRRLL